MSTQHHHHRHHGRSPTRAQQPGGADTRAGSDRRLLVALCLTAGFLLVEAIAGFLSGSLALLSDAGHMLTDAGALALALYAQVLANRTRTGQRTFGFRRAEILAALVNGTVLAVSAVWVIVEALRRFGNPPAIPGVTVLVVAAAGLVVNLASAFVLSRGPNQSANIRAAVAHVLSDAAGSVAAIIAGALILWRGWTIADPLASIAISLLILFGAWRLVRDSVSVLMEGVPRSIDAVAVDRAIREIPGVGDLHDLHVWSVSDGFPVVTVHVVLAPGFHGTDVARAVASHIERRFGIAHATVQPEAPEGPLVTAGSLVRDRS